MMNVSEAIGTVIWQDACVAAPVGAINWSWTETPSGVAEPIGGVPPGERDLFWQRSVNARLVGIPPFCHTDFNPT
jgi:hypothetical protein